MYNYYNVIRPNKILQHYLDENVAKTKRRIVQAVRVGARRELHFIIIIFITIIILLERAFFTRHRRLTECRLSPYIREYLCSIIIKYVTRKMNNIKNKNVNALFYKIASPECHSVCCSILSQSRFRATKRRSTPHHWDRFIKAFGNSIVFWSTRVVGTSTYRYTYRQTRRYAKVRCRLL